GGHAMRLNRQRESEYVRVEAPKSAKKAVVVRSAYFPSRLTDREQPSRLEFVSGSEHLTIN
ncbi:hypothetical protein, partial [Cupriavidus oxalaticus]